HLRQLLRGHRDEVPTNPFWNPRREHALLSPPAAESSEERPTVVVRLGVLEIGMVDDGPSPTVRAQELEDARGPAVGVDLGAQELRNDPARREGEVATCPHVKSQYPCLGMAPVLMRHVEGSSWAFQSGWPALRTPCSCRGGHDGYGGGARLG